jgi:recombination protein RecR
MKCAATSPPRPRKGDGVLFESAAVERLVEAFRRLPGIGKRSAERLALHVLSAPPEEARFLSEAVKEARERIRRCSKCNNLTEQDPCSVCSDPHRDRTIVCVVEQPSGAMAVERGGNFRGVYYVLHGVLNPLEGIGPDELNLDRLVRHVRECGAKEVIVATNATAEGEATAQYLARCLGNTGASVSRIAHGVPMGGGLEFADDLTLSHALEGRKRI